MQIRRIPLVVASALCVVAAALPAVACIWDSDTLAAEAKGLPETLDVLTGRFDRMPPVYFEARLARATRAVEKDPDDLAAHDDAGAACDRLGRGDDAVAWMDRKEVRLKALGDAAPKEHRYRLLANRGTFRAHRWLRAGADRTAAADMRRAREEIAAAIALHPDAHFGRERYQLRAMDWILDPPPADGAEARSGGPRADFLGLKDFDGWTRPTGALAKAGYGDAVAGLSGLIVLGDAWQSVDVHHALRNAVGSEGMSSVALVANLRLAELIDAGRTSFDPAIGGGDAARERLGVARNGLVEDKPAARVRAWFTAARRAADLWTEARRTYAAAQIAAGRHPDTDPAFWDGFRAPAGSERPRLPD